MIYFFYKENFYINSKNYEGSNKILNHFIEVVLYIILIFFIFLPQITLDFKIKNFIQQYHFTEDELEILKYTFINHKYKAKCTFNKKTQKYFLDSTGDTICNGNREIFDKVVLSLSSLKFSSEINTDNVASTIDKLGFIEINKRLSIKLYLYVILLLVYFLIIFKYIGGLKNFTKFLFFTFIYYYSIYDFTPSQFRTIEWSKMIELLSTIILLFLYYILTKQRLIILSIMAIHLFFVLALKDYFIIIIIFLSITHQLVYLQSKPKE